MIFTLSRMPAASAALTTSSMAVMVVVSRAEQQIRSQFCSTAVLTKVSGATSTPRSTTSKPLPSSIILTRFLPMSCRSPLTVPMQALPTVVTPASARKGFSLARPLFMARAAIMTSGTKTSSRLNFSPTVFMPSSRLCMMSLGSSFSARAVSTRVQTALERPFCRFSLISFRIDIVLISF